MNFKLYEIDSMLRQAYIAADAYINQETGEIPDDWAKFLDDVQMERDKKALAVACMVRELLAEEEAISIERKRLQLREQATGKKAESLKTYLSYFIQQGEKIKDERVSIGWRKSQAVNIIDINKLPEAFRRVEISADKTLIRDSFKAGNAVPGAEIVEHQSLTIR